MTVYPFTYPTEKVEALFSLINKIEGFGIKQKAEVVLTGVFVGILAVEVRVLQPGGLAQFTIAKRIIEDTW